MPLNAGDATQSNAGDATQSTSEPSNAGDATQSTSEARAQVHALLSWQRRLLGSMRCSKAHAAPSSRCNWVPPVMAILRSLSTRPRMLRLMPGNLACKCVLDSMDSIKLKGNKSTRQRTKFVVIT